jgi:hypothetical protein
MEASMEGFNKGILLKTRYEIRILPSYFDNVKVPRKTDWVMRKWVLKS